MVKIGDKEDIAVVPQGGNTGLVEAGIPKGAAVLRSLSRLDRIRGLDPLDYTITVEAGLYPGRLAKGGRGR